MDWQTVETMGYAYYSARGYRVLIPVVRTNAYDFVAEKNGQFVRVNVKLAGLKDNKRPDSWSISSSGNKSEDNRKQMREWVDIYLAYLPHQQRFIELPGDFLSGGNSKARRIPQSLLTGVSNGIRGRHL